MDNLMEAILWELDAVEKGVVENQVRQILSDDYDLLPTSLNTIVD